MLISKDQKKKDKTNLNESDDEKWHVVQLQEDISGED